MQDGGWRSRRTSSPDRCCASIVASPSKHSSERLLSSLFIFSLCSSVTPCLTWRYELWVVPEAKSADHACREVLGGGAMENVSNQWGGGCCCGKVVFSSDCHVCYRSTQSLVNQLILSVFARELQVAATKPLTETSRRSSQSTRSQRHTGG